MKGTFYRMGIAIKEAGELAGHKRWYAGVLIRLGLAIRDYAARW